MAGKTAVLSRPVVHYSRSGGGGNRFASAPQVAAHRAAVHQSSEADQYLHRSQALVEQLRRAVTERTAR